MEKVFNGPHTQSSAGEVKVSSKKSCGEPYDISYIGSLAHVDFTGVVFANAEF